MLVTGAIIAKDDLRMSKSAYKRADRVADQIRMEVADILLRKIKDPRIRSVTVTGVELTADLRIAHVFVTTMESEEAEREIFLGLSKAKGYIRAELGRRLTLRYLPEVIFKKDISGIRGDRILRLLDSLHPHEDEVRSAPSPDSLSQPAE